MRLAEGPVRSLAADRSERLGRDHDERHQAKIDRVTQAFLPMRKFDIAALMAAAENREEPIA
jgi:hypothetical protein